MEIKLVIRYYVKLTRLTIEGYDQVRFRLESLDIGSLKFYQKWNFQPQSHHEFLR